MFRCTLNQEKQHDIPKGLETLGQTWAGHIRVRQNFTVKPIIMPKSKSKNDLSNKTT